MFSTRALSYFLISTLLTLLVITGGVVSVSANKNSDLDISSIVTQINKQRSKEDLAPLRINKKLNMSAQAKSDDLILNDYYSHTSPSKIGLAHLIEDAGYRYRLAGENLVFHFFTAEEVVQSWMNSPGHRKNIMNPLYFEVGVGITSGEFIYGIDTTMVSAHFAAPSSLKDTVKLPDIEQVEFRQIAIIKTRNNQTALK